MRKATNAKRFRGRSDFNDFIRRIALISSSLFLSAIDLQPLYLHKSIQKSQIPFTIFGGTKNSQREVGFAIEFVQKNYYFSDTDEIRCKCCHFQKSDYQTQKQRLDVVKVSRKKKTHKFVSDSRNGTRKYRESDNCDR